MDIMQSFHVRYGSVDIEVVHDPSIVLTVDNFDTHAFLTFKSAEDLMGWKQYSASEKINSKQGKALQGNCSTPRKEFVTDSKGRKNEMGVIPFGLFHRIVLWQAEKNNPKAKSIISAGYQDSVRSVVIEQVTGTPVPLADRLRKIDEDRNQFYQQYAAGISDKEWLEGNAIGFMGGLDMSQTSHWVVFSDGFVPQFLTAAVARGEDPDVVLETMRIKYEGTHEQY